MLRLTMILVLLVPACGGGDDDPSADAAIPVVDGGGGPDAVVGTPDAGTGGLDPADYDKTGCLTAASAHPVCCERPNTDVNECNGGDGTEASLCGFMAACKLTDLSQCSIDCVMAPAVFCVTEEQVQCVIDAWATEDCVAAMACTGWLIF